MNVDLQWLQIKIEDSLKDIEKLFTEDCRITLIIRKPNFNESDIVLTRDDFNEVIKVIERSKLRERFFNG